MTRHHRLNWSKWTSFRATSPTCTSSLRRHSLIRSFCLSAFSAEHPHQYPLHVKEETIDSCAVAQPSLEMPPNQLALKFESISSMANILSSPPATAIGNRRASVRQQKRRSQREPNSSKDSSLSAKKRTKFDSGNLTHTDMGADAVFATEQMGTRSNSTDQQSTESSSGRLNFTREILRSLWRRVLGKRYRPAARRGGKKSVNQQGKNEPAASSKAR